MFAETVFLSVRSTSARCLLRPFFCLFVFVPFQPVGGSDKAAVSAGNLTFS